MRLKNKKTGETYEGWLADLALEKHYGSLAELNAEWCDAPEEPKDFYIVEQRGIVGSRFNTGNEYVKQFKEIGNYFLSREEAELALRKLKAWRRLKDKGFRFVGWDKALRRQESCDFVVFCDFDGFVESEKDLDLLFCTEVKNELAR